MKKLITILLLATAIPCLSQSITNTDFTVNGSQIIVTYDLNADAAQTFDISLYISTNNGSTWQGPLKHVMGNIGEAQTAGNNRLIIWDVIREYGSLKGTIGFQVRAKSKVDKNLPEMVFVKGGTFQMGSNESDDEKPIHSVTVSDFYIGKYEVTNAEFVKFLNAKGNQEEGGAAWINLGGSYEDEKCRLQESGSRFTVQSGYDNYPVIYVSWYGARAYCKWLKETTGKGFRLPTEAEWEYAAGGGNVGQRHAFAGTNTESSLYRYANFADKNTDYSWSTKSQNDNYAYTAPIGKYLPNELGIYDMSGNVWEWCEDTWHSNYQNAPINGSAWIDEKSNIRLVRGGSWSINPNLCRVADRLSYNPYYRFNYIGFRVVRH